MKSYWMFFIPAVVFFALPVVNILYQSAKASAAAKAAEEQRRRATEIKQVQQAAKQAAKERAAEMKKAEKEKRSAGSKPKRKPGRPRKSQPAQRTESILEINEAEMQKPVIDTDKPDWKPEKPAPLPTACTLEQFAAWIG